MARRILSVKSHPSSPYILEVRTGKLRPKRSRKERMATLQAMDETGMGAVPALVDVLRAYRKRLRKEED